MGGCLATINKLFSQVGSDLLTEPALFHLGFNQFKAYVLCNCLSRILVEAPIIYGCRWTAPADGATRQGKPRGLRTRDISAAVIQKY